MLGKDRPRVAAAALAMGIAAFASSSSSCLQIAGFDDFTFADTSPPDVEPVFAPLRDDRPRKMDILLVLDDSSSGAPALAQLTTSLKQLFGEVLNPPCVAANGDVTRVTPTARCPEGTVRASPVVADVHVGIVTSSLGTYGVQLCPPAYQINRLAHLYSGAQSTWNDSGVFVFDLAGTHQPPGNADADALAASIEAAVGDLLEEHPSCGIEQQLEAWFHFLVDPDPRETGGPTDEGAADETLLAQRAAFLRPDSIVFVIVVSDENDGSMFPDAGRYFYQPGDRMPPTTACADDPASPCCGPCLDGECLEGFCDPSCTVGCEQDEVHQDIDTISWDTKRRYGIDPYRPISRYVDALSAPTLETDDGSVDNPLFAARRPEDVYFTVLAGVPWQDVARVGEGGPDLVSGLDASGIPRGGLMSGSELEAAGVWSLLLGDPPGDPHMITTPEIRTAIDPRTGAPLPGPDAEPLADPIHGREYDTLYSDLQHACLGPLLEPIACEGGAGCVACSGVVNPVCDDPTTGENDPAVQHWSYAYPGTRYLEVARALGDQAIVGSICAVQVEDRDSPDYGYTAAIVGGISDKLKPRLRAPSCGPKVTGEARDVCRVVEARVAALGECDCPAPGRRELRDDTALSERVQADPSYVEAGWNCVCEIVPADDLDLAPCREQPGDTVTSDPGYLAHGWCDLPGGSAVATTFPDACSADETPYRLIGDARPLPGAGLFIDCR